jgi:hypothetical protein
MFEVQNSYNLRLDSHLRVFAEKPEETANNIMVSV